MNVLGCVHMCMGMHMWGGMYIVCGGMCICGGYVPVCVCGYVYVCVGMCKCPQRAVGECQNPWSRSYKQLRAPLDGCWRLNSGVPQEQHVLLTAELCLQN